MIGTDCPTCAKAQVGARPSRSYRHAARAHAPQQRPWFSALNIGTLAVGGGEYDLAEGRHSDGGRVHSAR
jgi:hypothetical protein